MLAGLAHNTDKFHACFSRYSVRILQFNSEIKALGACLISVQRALNQLMNRNLAFLLGIGNGYGIFGGNDTRSARFTGCSIVADNESVCTSLNNFVVQAYGQLLDDDDIPILDTSDCSHAIREWNTAAKVKSILRRSICACIVIRCVTVLQCYFHGESRFLVR